MIRAGFLRQDKREELLALARDGRREARASRRANAILNHVGGDAERLRLSEKTGEARIYRVANDVSPLQCHI